MARVVQYPVDITTAVADLPSFLTFPEAARYLRRSKRALRRWEDLGRLQVLRPGGGNPLVARDEIVRLLTEK